MNAAAFHSPMSVRLTRTFGFVVLVMVLIAALGLYLRIRETMRQRKELAGLQLKLQEQRILHPLYQELSRAAATPLGSALPCPPKQALARSEVIEIPDRFLKAAEQCGLKLGGVRPHLSERADASRQLDVDVQMVGPYGQLRPFLLSVMSWPSFVRIDRMEIRQGQVQEEFDMKIQLLLE